MDNCAKCSQPLEMYYVPWCPRCDKPTLQTRQSLNVVQALHHIQAITKRTGTKEKFNLDDYYGIAWRWFCENVDFRNDSYVDFNADIYLEEYDNVTDEIKQFIDVFDLKGKRVLLHFSW